MDPRRLLDDLLEISVVGSFTRVGYSVRRWLFAWPEPPPMSLAGRVVLVTGPTSGLGRAATEAVASLGARVILVGRDGQRLEALSTELQASHGADRFPWVVADLSSVTAVREAVEHIRSTEHRLDVLIDNAGAINAQRRLSVDGIEATFATMVLGPFVLIGGLLPLVEASGGRVVSVVSGGLYGQSLDLDDLSSGRGTFDGARAYAKAKRASLTLNREWARRTGGRGIRFNAMHPGWADTPGLAGALPAFHRVLRPILRSPAQGIDTTIWLATDTDAGQRGGELFLDRRARPFDRVPMTRLDRTARRRLWDEVVRMSGLPDPVTDPHDGGPARSGLGEPAPTARTAQ